jgi:hypothetical protein
MTFEQLQEFWQVVREEEAAIGKLNRQMAAIQSDPLKRTLAGAEEFWSLFNQTKPHSERI